MEMDLCLSLLPAGFAGIPWIVTLAFQAHLGIISNNSSFRQKHPGVPDGSDGSDGTSYPLTENYTLPIAQATCRVAYHQQNVF